MCQAIFLAFLTIFDLADFPPIPMISIKQFGCIKDIFDHTDCLCIHQTIIKQGGFTYFPQCRAPNICCSRSSSPPPPFRFLFSLSIAMCRPYFVIFTHPHFRLAVLWSIKKFQDVFFVIGLSKKTSVKAKLH